MTLPRKARPHYTCSVVKPAFFRDTLVLAGLLSAPSATAAEPVTNLPSTTSSSTTSGATAAPAAVDPWALDGPIALDVDVRFGVAARLDAPALYPADSDVGLLWGAGADVFLSQRLSLGLAYEHVDLGREDSGVLAQGTVRVERDLNNVWARLRIHPYRSEVLGISAALGLGATWQSAQLAGSVWPRAQPDLAQPLRCEGAASANFALRGELAADLATGDSGARVQLGGAFDAYRLSDELMGDCVPGAGAANVLSLRLTFVYGMDLP